MSASNTAAAIADKIFAKYGAGKRGASILPGEKEELIRLIEAILADGVMDQIYVAVKRGERKCVNCHSIAMLLEDLR